VRGRALSVFQLVFSGGMAGGSAVWGLVAQAAGITEALVCAAALLLLTMLAVARWPLSVVE
jgi:predicted MFS family arabinose efflux permease